MANVGNKSLISGFLRSAEQFPDSAALEAQEERYSYRELLSAASKLAHALVDQASGHTPQLTAILASRTPTAFSGAVAALLAGGGFVPLNPNHPPHRTAYMLGKCRCRSIIAGHEAFKQLEPVLTQLDSAVTVLLPEMEDTTGLSTQFARHTFLGANRLTEPKPFAPRSAPAESVAYVMFTSGTTGDPKGVMISHANLRPLLDFFAERYEVRKEDRMSVASPPTFDPWVFQTFLPWERGACASCLSERALLNPGKFIVEHGLTIWNSVPLVVLFMKRMGALKKGSYPALRLSIFAGETLTEETVASWSAAAPNSQVENLYGPTELTINCTYYRWSPSSPRRKSYGGVVPIGYPNPGMMALVCNETLEEVPVGATGELLMTGSQVALGYLDDAERTARSFVKPPGRNDIYYRTGDLVRRPASDEPLVYLGRTDSQVKVLGHRVELGEVEAVLRAESQGQQIVAVAWPPTAGGAAGIEVFIEGPGIDLLELKKAAASRLPDYMVPKRFHIVPNMPVNENGKCDRQALQRLLEVEQ